jgi:hypothetical protein
MPLFTPDQLARYTATMSPEINDNTERTTSTKSNPIYRLGQGLVLGGTGLDIGTTQTVLNQGGHEVNNLLGDRPSFAKLAGIKGGLAGLELYGMKKMRESGHPTRAGIIGGLASVLPMIAGIRNIKQIR